MNLSTGIKTKAEAIAILDAIKPDVSEDVIAKQNDQQKAFSVRENKLAASAKALAKEMISAVSESIVNAEIRTSAGAVEMISVRIVKH